jgi:hypothetical protein
VDAAAALVPAAHVTGSGQAEGAVTTAGRERPILFSSPMVRAILAGRKTQTRRILGWKPREDGLNLAFSGLELGFYCSDSPASGYVLRSRGAGSCWNDRTHPAHCPHGATGDRLWVRETHACFHVGEGLDRAVPECVAYRATCRDDGSFDFVNTRGEVMGLRVTKWTPSIFMPRWASRITLEITEIRVQRLQEISDEDAKAEGIERDTEPCDHTRLSCEEIKCLGPTHRSTFCELWDLINGKRAAWASNPWVWAITFRRVAAEQERKP